MFNWLTKLMMQTPHQGNCAGCGSANREQMEKIRQKMVNGEIGQEESYSIKGSCSCGSNYIAKEENHECDCGGNCGENCSCEK